MNWIKTSDRLPPLHEDTDDERGFVLLLMAHRSWPEKWGQYKTIKGSRVELEGGWYWADEDGEIIEDEDNLIKAWCPITISDELLNELL